MKGDKEPATRGDVRVAVEELAEISNKAYAKLDAKVGKLDAKVGKLDAKVGKLDAKVGKLDAKVGNLEAKMATKEGQERILSIVQLIDEHFREHRDLPAKVEELEADMFKIKTRLL